MITSTETENDLTRLRRGLTDLKGHVVTLLITVSILIVLFIGAIGVLVVWIGENGKQQQLNGLQLERLSKRAEIGSIEEYLERGRNR